MGLTVGCVISDMHESLNGGDIMQRGPSQPAWTVTTDSGRRLNLDEFKNSIRMPLTEREVLAVLKSWKTISQNLTQVGCNILLRSVSTINIIDVIIMVEVGRRGLTQE